MRTLALIAMIAGSGAVAASGWAQTPQPQPERPARYAMQPVDGGAVLRLDTETGAMALCSRRDNQMTCETVAIADADKEVDRLTRENRELKADIKRLEDLLAGSPSTGKRHAERSPKFELPSEEDVDKALSYLERMFKKFRDRMKDLEGGRGTPL